MEKIEKALHMEKNAPIKGEKRSLNISFPERRATTLAPPPPCGCSWAMIIKCTIFSEIIHHIIISKYTLECTQLNYFFLPSNLLSIKLNNVTCTASGMYYNTAPLFKKLYPHVWTLIVAVDKWPFNQAPPPPPQPPPITIGYETIIPC